MQTVIVDKNRKVNPNQIFVGNQYENQIESIKFNLPEHDGYQYLVINKNIESYAIPLDKEGVFYVDSLLTWRSGIYECNIVISGKELNESSEIDGTKLTFISNTIRLKVVSNSINASQLSKAPLPINLQIIYDDLLNLYEKVKKDYEDGSFDGEDGLSAYELAVKNGFKGTEQEWLESLRYDHSDEFKQLADQVKLDAKRAEDSATKAESAMNEANTIAQAIVKAINKASTDAQNAITTSKDNAIQAVATAKTSATTEITEQKESAVSTITQEKTSATEAIETGKTEAVTAIETAKDEAIEEIENTGVPLEDIEKLAIKETTQGNPTIIQDSAEWRLRKLNIYGQSEQDSTTGKNLLNPTGATKVGWNIELPNFRLEVGKQYTYTAPILEGSKACGLFAKASNTQLVYYIQSRKTQTFTVPEEADFSQGILLAGSSLDALTLGDELTAMVELGSVATEFEPYTGGKPSPSPDYPQEIISKEVSSIIVSNGANESQTITLTEPITLRGISVSSGGNVTIDGEQYISDVIKEKDGVIGVERKCYPKEFKIAEMDGSEEHPGWNNVEDILIFTPPNINGIIPNKYIWNIDNKGDQFLANTMGSNKIFILGYSLFNMTQSEIKEQYPDLIIKYVFQRLNPTFEPLPEEIQAQYKALKSYYPNTVIDTGCWNEVEYVADTKTYIDNKLTGVTELALGGK